MQIEWWPAIVAGLVGGVVMVAVRWLIRGTGVDLRMDVARMWGTMFGLHGGGGYAAGWLVHLMMSVLVAVIYAFGFTLIGVPAQLGWLWGLVGGVVHWAVAGVVMAMLPVMHPEIPERRAPPGPFVSGYGAPDMVGFLLGHLAFGLTVGIVYHALPA